MATIGRTWIVVLDDSRARFYRRERSGTLVEAAPAIDGDLRDGGDNSPRREQREALLRKAVRTLDQACDGSACDRLLVIGPERVLSGFRKLASDKIRARLWRERASEAASLPPEAIVQTVEPYFRGAD